MKEEIVQQIICKTPAIRFPGLNNGKANFSALSTDPIIHIHFLPERGAHGEFRIRQISEQNGVEVYIPYHEVAIMQYPNKGFEDAMEERRKRGVLTPYDKVPPEKYGRPTVDPMGTKEYWANNARVGNAQKTRTEKVGHSPKLESVKAPPVKESLPSDTEEVGEFDGFSSGVVEQKESRQKSKRGKVRTKNAG